MNSEDVLNQFGKLLITEAYDNHVGLVKHDLEDLKQTERFKNLFRHMTSIEKSELENLCNEILTGILFDFLRMFEESEDFKIVYERDGNQVDLVELSEMFKAEATIKDGWIDRFSKFNDKDNQEA